MLPTPFLFEPNLSDEDYQLLGKLSLRWSHTEHVIGNCLRVMLNLSEAEAILIVFPLSLDQRLEKMKELEKIKTLNDDAKLALSEILSVMKGIQYVRNNVIHAIVINYSANGHVFHLRSKKRTLTKAQIFSAEELTNYAAHAVYSLRYALGSKELSPGERYALPDRPEIPEFLRGLIPLVRQQISRIDAGGDHLRRNLNLRSKSMPGPIIFPFPVISEEDYPAFRREVGSRLADSYDEWLKLHREQVEQARRNGDTVAEIEIKYDEFMIFCRTTGTSPNMNTLLDFTVKQAGWKT